MEQIEQIKTWWQRLEGRERNLLMSAGVLSMIVLFYWLVWQPLNQAEFQAQQRMIKQRNDLAYVKSMAHQIVNLRVDDERPRSLNISSVISSSANNYGLNVTRLRPQGETINVRLDDANFNRLLEWLHFLVEEYHISIDTFHLKRSEEPGIVEIQRLQISR